MSATIRLARSVLYAATLALGACGNVARSDATPDAGSEPGTDASSADSGSDPDGEPAVCAAGTALRCDGTNLVSCNSAGTAEIQTACGLRCDAAALACEDAVDPSNGHAAQLDAAIGQPAVTITQQLFFSTETDFDASAGTIKVGDRLVKAALAAGANGAPDVVVLSVGSFTVASGVKLSVFGNRPVAIMSAGDITIEGTLEIVTGFATVAEACFGASSGATGADNDVPGAGGGGFGQVGGNGGSIIGIAAGKSGGTSIGTSTLIPLRGGCSGGTDALGGGGRGGGSAQLTSATRIRVTGAIGANGGGGAVSSGGGSGGALLLEAPMVELSGGVFANGGGGGCGGFSSGANGTNSLVPAPGANCGGTAGTALGGSGGAGTTAATQGGATTNRTGSVDRAGGGGGAVGRIRINTLDASIIGAGAQSPPASTGPVRGR